MPKVPEKKYGIEITKPFSKEMYDHNDKIAKEMKDNIIAEIEHAYMRAIGSIAASGGMDKGEEDLRKLITSFSGYQFGDGYELSDIKSEGTKMVQDAANWMMHEEYSYLCFEGLVPRVSKMMIGFDWEKHDYSLQD